MSSQPGQSAVDQATLAAQPNLLQQSAPHLQTLGGLVANPHSQQLYQKVTGQAPNPNILKLYQQVSEQASNPQVQKLYQQVSEQASKPQVQQFYQQVTQSQNPQNQEIPSYLQATANPPGVPPRMPNPGQPEAGQLAPAGGPVAPLATLAPAPTFASPAPAAAPHPAQIPTPVSSNDDSMAHGGAQSAPKPAPDPLLFAPPPIHKNRGALSGSKSAPNKSSLPVPQLPSRPSATRIEVHADQAPPPYAGEGGRAPSRAESFEHARYTPLDPSKVGPPPPRRHDSAAKELRPSSVEQPLSSRRHSPSGTGSSAMSLPPPPPPPRSASAASDSISAARSSSNLHVSETVHPPKPKKVPPPKPKKLQAVNLTGNSVSKPLESEVAAHQESESASGQKGPINFAAEIANLRLGKAKSQPIQKSQDSEVDHKKSPPPKPVKPQIQSKGTSAAKPLLGADKKPSSIEGPPVKPAKPGTFSNPEKPIMITALPTASTKPAETQDSSKIQGFTPASSVSPPPPPARAYRRAPAPIPKAETSVPELDLEISTGWFAKNPLKLPKSLQGLNYSSSSQYSTSTSGGIKTTDNKRSLKVTLPDLARIEYAFQWRNQDAANALVQMVNYTPSPISQKVPTKAELIGYSSQFGDHIVSWCEHHLGQQVGSGECWDLARYALEKGCGNYAFVSQYYHHGFPILEVAGSTSGLSVTKEPMDEVRPGDILQFKSAKFENKARGSIQTVGSPDHTSVVVGKDMERIFVLEQNVCNVKTVQRGEYVLRDITQGCVSVYRPMPKTWAE